jgi:hypothetical protein
MSIDAHCGRNVIHIQVVRYILVVSCTTPKTGAPRLFENKKRRVWQQVAMPPIWGDISPNLPSCVHYLTRNFPVIYFCIDHAVHAFKLRTCIALRACHVCTWRPRNSLSNVTAFTGFLQNSRKFWASLIFVAIASWWTVLVGKFMGALVNKFIAFVEQEYSF